MAILAAAAATGWVTTSLSALSGGATGAQSAPAQWDGETSLVIVGPAAGPGRVRAASWIGPSEIVSAFPFGAGFAGGVTLATGDLDGDDIPDAVVAMGAGGGLIRAYSGVDGRTIVSGSPYGPAFTGGVAVAVGDIDGDGRLDIVTGPHRGAGRIRVFSGVDFREIASALQPLGAADSGGVYLAAGDVDGDGRAEVVAAQATGGLVSLLSGTDLSPIVSAYPFGAAFSGGVSVAMGDFNGDGRQDVVVAQASGGAMLRVYSGADQTELVAFAAVPGPLPGGLRVAAADLTGDGRAEIIAGAGPGGPPYIGVWDGNGFGLLGVFQVDHPASVGGVTVAAAGPSRLRFTSADLVTFTAGAAGSFEITTAGGGVGTTIALTGTLPAGVTFTDHGDGTATLAGTPEWPGGTFPLTLTATAGTRTATQAFTLTVIAVNQPPSFTAGPNQTVAEDAGAQIVPGWATNISPGPPHESGQTVTFNASVDNASLFAALPAVAPDGTLQYTPAADANGTATIMLTLSDDGGTAGGGIDTSAPQAFTITVTPVNDAPSFTAGAHQSAEDAGPQSVVNWATAITAGPPDEAGQTLTFMVTANTNPTLFSGAPAVSPTGTLAYTAAPNAFGSADITVVLRDNGGTGNGGVDTSAPQAFTITVVPVSDPPVAVDDSYAVENRGTTSVVAPGVLANDIDPDTPMASLVATLVTGPANAVFFALNPNGSFTYVHDGSNTSADSFAYRVSDGSAESNLATVTLTITPVSDPLETEPNDSAETATVLIGSDVAITGNIFPSGDVDYYSFTAQAGDRVYAATMTAASANANLDSRLMLLATDGSTVLELDDDDGTFGATSSGIAGAVIPSDGTYYLRVSHPMANGQIRPYRLWLRVVGGTPAAEVEPNDAIPGQPLPASGWVAGALSSATDADFYAVTLGAGDTVFASLDLDPERDGVEWNGQLGMGPFGSPGVILVANDGGAATPDSESLFLTVKDAGTYYLVVNVPTGGTTFGTYQLSVSVRPAATPSGTTYASVDVPVTIPTGPAIVTSTITIPEDIRIGRLKVAIDLTHNFMADLDVTLTSPDGNTVALFTDVGSVTAGAQTQMNLVLDDDAAIPVGQFTAVSGLVFRPELSYRLEWFKGQRTQGTWTLTIRDDAAVDGGTLNNWSLIVVEDEPLPAGTPRTIFSTDFESDDGGFTHSGTQDEWEWGAPTAAPIATANSGVNVWKTDLDDTYNANANLDLFSPEIDLTAVTFGSVLIEWAMKFQLESAQFDYAFIDVEEVGGDGRTRRLWEWLGADMIASIGNPVTAIQEASGWGRYRAVVDDFLGRTIRLRFHLQTDATVQRAGLAIDDVSVTAFEPQAAPSTTDVRPASPAPR